MMRYKINGYLYLSKNSQLSLGKPLSYQHGNLRVLIKNNAEKEGRVLDVSLELDAKNRKSSLISAEIELERISNLISWFSDVPIPKWRISEMTFIDKRDSKSVVVTTKILTKQLRYCIKKSLDNKKIKNLIKQLTQNYHLDFEDTLIMWRQALVENSKGFQFLLFYRILEKLCGKKEELENFIKTNLKNVKIIKDRGKQKTIFTYLRDNIHPKDPRFPYDKIEKYLPQIQNLVKKRIQDVFS